MSKQTAVEWLVEKYELVGMLTLPMIERAQAMEREQMRLPNCKPMDGNIESVTIFDPVTGETLYKGGEQ